MKKICIKRSHFNKVVGYGLWSLMTLGLLSLIPIVQYEISDVKIPDYEYYSWDGYEATVQYHSYFDHNRLISESNYERESTLLKYGAFITANIINFGAIGVKIYKKQQKIKFSFCEADAENKE